MVFIIKIKLNRTGVNHSIQPCPSFSLWGLVLKGTIMTSFVHPQSPKSYSGAQRAQALAEQFRSGFDSARGLAAMLLSLIVSALLVVADQLIDTWAGTHLMLAWLVLWAVGFAAIALFAGTVRRFSARVVGELDAWSARVAQTRADERLWAIALKDARVMADLQAALARADHDVKVPPRVVELARAHWTQRQMQTA